MASTLYPAIFTDKTTAELFAFLFSQNVRYDHQRAIWLIWDKHYWHIDTKKSIQNFVFQLGEMIMQEGEDLRKKEETVKRGDYLFASGMKLHNITKLKSTLSVAQAMSPIAMEGNEFDHNPLLLGVPNGIIDLTTGKCRDGKTTDYISIISPIEYDPSATCPLWEDFMHTIFEGDSHLIHWMQRVLGYAITGDMREQKVFLFYGIGGNGKSRLLDVLQGILGDYMKKTPKDFFNKQTFFHQINDPSFMRRKRVIFNSENTSQITLDTELIKSISSPDMQRGRELFQNPVDFMPVCKMFISTNNLPHFEDDSYGFDRRMLVIPFNHKFEGKKEIKDYHKILLTEASGILNWLIEGCLLWQKEGISDIPDAVITATTGYKRENNPLVEYLEERTVKEPGEQISTTLMYADYQMWVLRFKKTLLSQTGFAKKMQELGYEKIHKEQGNFYINLRLHM